jgi:ACS family glucarate transporter-like MFS transporter
MVENAVAPASAAPATRNVRSIWASKRLYIAAFLFFNVAINYMHRVTLSVAAPAIAKEFAWNPATMGLIFSSYMWTYAFFLAPWGMLADRFGTRNVNAISVTMWSVAGVLTGVITGFISMMMARLTLGVGEAASFPACGKVVRQWFPADERGLATAIFNSGTFAGPAVTAPAVAWLILHTGWRGAFVITGLLGLVWAGLWMKYFDIPKDCSWLPAEEREYIVKGTGSTAEPAPKGTLLRLAGRTTMWGLFLTQGCCAYTMFFYLLWLPSYMVQERHMDLMKASLFTAVPYLVASVFSVLAGALSDKLLTPEAVRQGKRRRLLIVFILLSCIVVLTNVFANQWIMLVLVCTSLTCISSALTLNIAMTSDLVWNPNIVGTALGISILGGIVFGITAPIVTGFIVKWTGSFSNAFYVAGALLLVAALTALTLTRKPLSFEDAAIQETE